MRTHWILFISMLSLALGNCGGSSQAVGERSPTLVPLDQPSQESMSGSPKNNTFIPELPVPTIGSVVITNTTATPISSANSASALTPDSILQGLAQRARQDLANRLNVSSDQVDFLKVVSAKWPYDNVGCPSNGESVDTSKPGYQILLSANDQTYMYHTDGKDWIGLCTVKSPNEIQTLP